MRKLLALSLICLFINLQGQDKIIKKNGDTLKVTITKSSPETVEFTYPKESIINTEYKSGLARIIYSTGRIEECSAKKLAQVNGKKDWEKVELTNNAEDVKGLTKIGEVKGKSSWGGLVENFAERKAREAIKKAAAKKNGSIVYITSYTTNYNGSRIYGIAYK